MIIIKEDGCQIYDTGFKLGEYILYKDSIKLFTGKVIGWCMSDKNLMLAIETEYNEVSNGHIKLNSISIDVVILDKYSECKNWNWVNIKSIIKEKKTKFNYFELFTVAKNYPKGAIFISSIGEHFYNFTMDGDYNNLIFINYNNEEFKAGECFTDKALANAIFEIYELPEQWIKTDLWGASSKYLNGYNIKNGSEIFNKDNNTFSFEEKLFHYLISSKNKFEVNNWYYLRK